MVSFRRVLLPSVAVIAAALAASPVSAETLTQALAQAYNNNPTLNAMRAQLRATDENVPQALSGYRPIVTAGASAGVQWNRTIAGFNGATYPRQVALTIEQPLFRGFRTQNSVKQAESAVLAGRQILRSTEQDVLLDAVTAYADVIQNQAILGLRQQNVTFLNEQVRAAQDRLNVGEGTRTDLAQTQAALAQGESGISVATANLNTSMATYQQVIGVRPKALAEPRFNDKLIARSVGGALDTGLKQHPAILAAGYNVDTAAFNVKVLEGQLLPTVSLQGSVSHSDDLQGRGVWQDSASITANLTVPIYEGGLTYSQVRQAKETLGQRRIELDFARDQVRAAVVSGWGQLTAARATIESALSQIRAAQLALEGVIEERKVGQRTTLDVLNQQQSVLNARELLVVAQRTSIVAAYTVLSATGGLSADRLGLAVERYEPTQHYQAVRDKWIGLRTPDGR